MEISWPSETDLQWRYGLAFGLAHKLPAAIDPHAAARPIHMSMPHDAN